MTTDGGHEPTGTDPDNAPVGEHDQQGAPEGDSGQAESADFDWKAQARKNEGALKREREARKQLEEKVKSLFTPEEVQSKDQLLSEAQREAEQAKAEALRLRIAISEGLPADLAERLRGSTEEELRADAEALKTWAKPANPAAEAKKASLQTPPEAKPDPNALLRQIIASR